MLSVIVGSSGHVPLLPRQWQPSSQSGRFDKTVACICDGTCRIESICNSSTETPVVKVAEFFVAPVKSFIIAIGIDKGERQRAGVGETRHR